MLSVGLMACANAETATDVDVGRTVRDTGSTDRDTGRPQRDTGPQVDTSPGVDTTPSTDSGTDSGTPDDTGGVDTTPSTCIAPEIDCGGNCVDTWSNVFHCGGCDMPCAAGEVCSSGECGLFCGGSMVACAGACVETAIDRNHCGTCNNACAENETCAIGACRVDCGSQTDCSGVCVDTLADASNCGTCGTTCRLDQECSGGTCSCPGGLLECGGACVDGSSDVSNCGTCGNACPAGDTCIDSACVCPGGLTRCDGTCVDTTVEPSNCGTCGTTCGALEACVDGGCSSTCPDGQSICAASCVDTDTSGAHCGGCDMPCRGDESCESGSCECPSGTTDCAGACRDFSNDPEACGSCGNACRADQVCSDSACACPAGQLECGGTCLDVSGDDSNCGACGTVCDADRTCASSSCVCAGDLTECGGNCVDTDEDLNHCGGCGISCGVDELCHDGGCVTECPPGLTECGTTCSDTSTDPNNCGECGNSCDETGTCNAGFCGCADDHLEPNDSTDQALLLPIGTNTPDGANRQLRDLILCDGDVDEFRFGVPGSSGHVRVATSGECNGGPLDTQIQLVNEAGSVVETATGGGAGNCAVMDTTVAGGIWSVRISSPGSIPGSYDVELTIDAVSELEGNDTTSVADGPFHRSSYAIGSVDNSGFLFVEYDYDVYFITLHHGTMLTLSTSAPGNPSACDFDSVIELYNSAGSSITSDDDGGTGVCSVIGPRATAPGTYYVEVRSYGDSGGNYRLTVDAPLAGEVEPNGRADTATTVADNRYSVEGALQTDSDADYYALTVTSDRNLDIVTRGLALDCEADTIVELVSSDGETVLLSDDSSGATNSATGLGSCGALYASAHPELNPLAAGDYYVVVRGFSGRKGGYLLNVLAP